MAIGLTVEQVQGAGLSVDSGFSVEGLGCGVGSGCGFKGQGQHLTAGECNVRIQGLGSRV